MSGLIILAPFIVIGWIVWRTWRKDRSFVKRALALVGLLFVIFPLCGFVVTCTQRWVQSYGY